MKILSLILLLILIPSTTFAAQTCNYTYSIWNTVKKQTIKTVKVSKKYSELTKEEQGPFGCTPCEEDQTEIVLNNGLTTKICKKIAPKIEKVLNMTFDQYFKIKTITGYRPSISRGPADKNGNRTLFSNHAYGTAIDINENKNGLYANCKEWHDSCHLIKGGYYYPSNPLAIKEDSVLVKEMKSIGFEWGGLRKDSLKDFMHFSPDGL